MDASDAISSFIKSGMVLCSTIPVDFHPQLYLFITASIHTPAALRSIESFTVSSKQYQ